MKAIMLNHMGGPRLISGKSLRAKLEVSLRKEKSCPNFAASFLPKLQPAGLPSEQ